MSSASDGSLTRLCTNERKRARRSSRVWRVLLDIIRVQPESHGMTLRLEAVLASGTGGALAFRAGTFGAARAVAFSGHGDTPFRDRRSNGHEGDGSTPKTLHL